MSIFKDIWIFITGAAKKVAEALSTGNKVANIIKTGADSPILDLVVSLTSTEIDNIALKYIRLKLSEWVVKIGWAEKKLSDFDSTTLPHVLNAINAEASKIKADFDGVKLSRPEAIASAQVVYDPGLVQ